MGWAHLPVQHHAGQGAGDAVQDLNTEDDQPAQLIETGCLHSSASGSARSAAHPGPFERLEVAESPWGPVLGGRRPRVACRLAGSTPVGYAELVEGEIEQLELVDLEDPLAYLHGGYRSVDDVPDHG